MKTLIESNVSVGRVIGIVILASALFSGTGQAQSDLSCSRATYGQVTCMAVKLCECIYDRGGAMTDVPAGFRWDCGILRPRCETVPATIMEYRGNVPAYPAAVAIDHSDERVTFSQDSTNTNTNTTGTNSNTNSSTNSNTNTQ